MSLKNKSRLLCICMALVMAVGLLFPTSVYASSYRQETPDNVKITKVWEEGTEPGDVTVTITYHVFFYVKSLSGSTDESDLNQHFEDSLTTTETTETGKTATFVYTRGTITSDEETGRPAKVPYTVECSVTLSPGENAQAPATVEDTVTLPTSYDSFTALADIEQLDYYWAEKDYWESSLNTDMEVAETGYSGEAEIVQSDPVITDGAWPLYNITITNKANLTSYTIAKVWPKDVTPEDVSFSLLRNGEEYKTVTLTEENADESLVSALGLEEGSQVWVYTFDNLPVQTNDGTAYTYTAKENSDKYQVSETAEEYSGVTYHMFTNAIKETETETETESQTETKPQTESETETETEVPASPQNPDQPSGTAATQTRTSAARTGDNAPLGLWIALAAGSAVTCIYLGVTAKRKKQHSQDK